jgi:uncharacterized membrane protein
VAEVFISYSRADQEFVLKLAKDMRQRGVDLWLDQLDLKPGGRWDDQIQAALQKCTYLLVVLSPTSVKSQNVKDEIGFAIDEGDTVIPILYQPTAVPLRLRRFQWVDFRGDYEKALKKLVGLLPSSGAPASTPKAQIPQPAASAATTSAGVREPALRPAPTPSVAGPTVAGTGAKRRPPWLWVGLGVGALVVIVFGLIFMLPGTDGGNGEQGAFVSPLPGGSSETTDGFFVTNDTDELIRLAIEYFDSGEDSWITEGWWQIEPGDAVQVLPFLDGNEYFLYAYGEDTGTEWAGEDDSPMIDPQNDFSIDQSTLTDDEVEEFGYEERGFFYVDTGDSTSWTQPLNY